MALSQMEVLGLRTYQGLQPCSIGPKPLKKLEKTLKNCVGGAYVASDCDVIMKNVHSTFLELLTNEEMT